MLMLIFIGFIFSTFSFQSSLYAEEPLPSIAPRGDFIPPEEAFKAVTRAHKNFDYPRAIVETKRIIRKHPDKTVVEIASYLLGNLHIIMAERGFNRHYEKAVNAFQDARWRHPDSDQGPHALLKIAQIQTRRKFYYEAIAYFNRTIKKNPKNNTAAMARFGKIETYLVWKKWKKAIAASDEINPASLSKNNRLNFLLGYANAYFHLGQLSKAVKYYHLVPIHEAVLQTSPTALFQYGLSAYRLKDYATAYKLFSIIYDRHPKDENTPVARARIGDIARLTGKETSASKIYLQVLAMKIKHPEGQTARLIAVIGQFYLSSCQDAVHLKNQNNCPQKGINSITASEGIQKIVIEANHILKAKKHSGLDEGVLFEAITALENENAFSDALRLEGNILAKKNASPYRKKILTAFRKTVSKTIAQLMEDGKMTQVVTLYFKHRSAFTKEVLRGTTGLHIGIALSEVSLYRESIKRLAPIALLKNDPLAEKALFSLAKAHFLQGNSAVATLRIKEYFRRYPASIQTPLLKAFSASITDKKGETALAIKKYTAWLDRYPDHPEREHILQKLAAAYQKKGNLREALASHLKIEADLEKSDPDLYLNIADIYFR
ncbi:MAG: tetratricopeptide repeat protein, partial [Nitrospiria bacterium]